MWFAFCWVAPALDSNVAFDEYTTAEIDWINLIKLFIKHLIRKMTNWPTSWKVIFGDHTTQQIIFPGGVAEAPKTWKIDFVGWRAGMRTKNLFVHISKSINLNMRSELSMRKRSAIVSSSFSECALFEEENRNLFYRLHGVSLLR